MPRLLLAAALALGAALPAAAQSPGNGATTCTLQQGGMRCTTSVEMGRATLLRGVSVRFVPGNVPGRAAQAQAEAFAGECGTPPASLGRMAVVAGRGAVTFPTRMNYGLIPPRSAIGPLCVEVVLSACAGGDCGALLPAASIAVSFTRE